MAQEDTIESIKQQIAENPILLYMKGSPNQPQCGFSARASQALMACGERFAYVDVSRLTPAEAMDKYVDRTVIITGVTRYSTEAQGLVIEAENIVIK